jgi:hypothetical protein
MYEYTAAGAYVTEGSATIALTSSLTRFSFTRTLTGATTERVMPRIEIPLTNGTAYNFTIRIGLPQMELGSVATSVILTTTQAITRGADVINKTGVSSLIGQTEGTIYVEVDIRTLGNTAGIFVISDNTNTNRVYLYKLGTNNRIYAERQSATESATSTLQTSGSITAGIYKIAIAYKSGDTALFVNGVQAGSTNTDTFTMGSVFKLNVGSNRAEATQLNDRIRAAAVYPTRLSNTELQALTA